MKSVKKSALLVSAMMLSFAATSASAVTVIDSNLTYQITGEVKNQTGDSRGGAYMLNDTTTVGAVRSPLVTTVNNAVFDTNTVSAAAGDGYGGAIFLRRGTLNINGSEFLNNSASEDGGAISTVMPLRDASSAVVPHSGPLLVIDNSLFKGNSADRCSGGAIGLYSDAVIRNTTFEANNVGGSVPPATTDGGGAIYLGGHAQLVLENCDFIDNTSNRGGAIGTTAALGEEYSLSITGGSFVRNEALVGSGGAIYSEYGTNSVGNAPTITGVEFKNNEAKTSGGAVYTAGKLTVADSKFDGNIAKGADGGGAIKINVTNDVANNKVTITNTEFTGNKALANKADAGAVSIQGGNVDIVSSKFVGNEGTWGGAIYSYLASGDVLIKDSVFEGNKATDIGAVGSFSRNGKMNIVNTTFKNNVATGEAGALFTGSESTTWVENSTFIGNKAATYGGAIMTRKETDGDNTSGRLDIIDSVFEGNSSGSDGGAIYNAFGASQTEPTRVTVQNAVFSNNTSGGSGGAIFNADTDKGGNISKIEITDASFINNKAADQGGAIYASGDVNISAEMSDVIFSNNSATNGGGDIYMAAQNSNLNVSVGADRTVDFGSGISGVVDSSVANARYNMNVTGEGTLGLSSSIENANIAVTGATFQLNQGADINSNNNHITLNQGSTFSTMNNQVDDTFEAGLITVVGNDVKFAADLDMATGQGDKIVQAIDPNSTGSVIIDEINTINGSNSTASSMSVDIYEAFGITPNQISADSLSNIVVNDILTPIRYLRGSVNEQGMLVYGARGNHFNDYNPSVLVSPVAAQLGGLMTQLYSYEEAFRNVDMNMLYTKKEREAMKFRNKYAITEQSGMKFNLSADKSRQDGIWARPFASYETVRLDGGPKVNNTSYGSYFGADSDMYTLKNGGDVQFSVYAGYNGSHQSFMGNSIYQNGGTLGMSGVYYKGNFFTALTANVGASVAEASTMYGSEDFTMLMSGVASKTGYNFEIKEGKFIVQPNLLMSYSFVNTFDYTNAAGVRINADPLHALHLAPGMKFIANMKNGWQPYLSVAVNWNILDESSVTAAQTSLPEMSVKPYVSYGVGVQRRWSERLTGFLQTMVRSGGRNGIAFATGFKFAFGKRPIFNPNAKPKVIKSL